MKKIFTLMAAAVMALAANAKDFKGDIVIDLGMGTPTTQETTISVEEIENSDGLYNIVLKGFSFMNQLVGDVTLTEIKGDDVVPSVGSGEQAYTEFEQVTKTATIANGGDLAEMLGGEVDVTINEGSRMAESTLDMNISLTVSVSLIPGQAPVQMNINASFSGELVSNSKEYTDDLYVEVSGMMEQVLPKQEATIVVTKQDDGKYTLALKNFILGPSADEGMAVGTIEMSDVDGVEEDGNVKLSTEQTVTIQEGDDPSVPTWAMAGISVPVKMTAEMTGDKLTATIDITYDLGGGLVPGMVMYINVAFGYVPSGISNVTVTTDNGVEAIYDLSGKKLNEMQKGINIVRKADGTTVKVLKK